MRQWERSLHFPVAWVRFRSETEAEFFSGSRSAMRVFFFGYSDFFIPQNLTLQIPIFNG